METNSAKISRILVAVDDEPCAQKVIHYAQEMVRKFNASVALVTVTTPTSPASYGADPLLGQQAIIVPEVSEIQQESAQKYLEELSQLFVDAHEVFLFNKIGYIKQEILDTSIEWSADMIIMGSNGRTGFDHFISGSVSEAIIRKATCPVFVVPSKC